MISTSTICDYEIQTRKVITFSLARCAFCESFYKTKVYKCLVILYSISFEIYQSELEFENMMRNDPDFRIERATLDNIFESERERVVGRPSSDSEVVLDRRLVPGAEDERFESLLELLL